MALCQFVAQNKNNLFGKAGHCIRKVSIHYVKCFIDLTVSIDREPVFHLLWLLIFYLSFITYECYSPPKCTVGF